MLSDNNLIDYSDHIPVLLTPIKQILPQDLDHNTHVLDCTFGCGGYSHYFLDKNCHVVAFDQDPAALKHVTHLQKKFPNQLTFIQDRFSTLSQHCQENQFDIILFDIGVSSVQLDQAERGFSFMKDGPLDMRMSDHGKTAADIINQYSQEKLADIFYYFGEVRGARKFARLICERRVTEPFLSTLDLANFIKKHSAPPKQGRRRIHPATLIFQALRIEVNNELHEFETALEASIPLLKNSGYLMMVTFHSLEDRIAKKFSKTHSFVPKQSKYTPVDLLEKNIFKLLTKKPIVANEEETQNNPRATCAKLRALQKW